MWPQQAALRTLCGQHGLHAALTEGKTYSFPLPTLVPLNPPLTVFFIDLLNFHQLSQSILKIFFAVYTLDTQSVVCGPTLAPVTGSWLEMRVLGPHTRPIQPESTF